MARVKRGNIARKRRNKILNLAKGFRGGNKNLFRTANQRVMKALCNAYRDRRRRKRDFRRLNIVSISLTCGRFSMNTGLSNNNVEAKIGNAAFFEPDTRISPAKGPPPDISNLSMKSPGESGEP